MAAATKLPKVTLGAAQQIAEDRFLVGAIPVEAPLGQVAVPIVQAPGVQFFRLTTSVGGEPVGAYSAGSMPSGKERYHQPDLPNQS
jgi:hypothetical protein